MTTKRAISSIKKHCLPLILLLLILSPAAKSQNFIAYKDSMGFLYTFDNGVIRRLDERPVGQFRYGTSRVAFNIPYDHIFKISIGTSSTILFNDSVNDFWFSREMLVYLTPNYLNCFWNGRPQKLEFKTESFQFSDSIVAWVDRFYNFKCFFDGYTRELDNRLPREYKVSENLVAWRSINDMFRIFWKDSVYEVSQYEIREFAVGMNTCAYIDNQGVFKVFHKGKFYDMESLGNKKFLIADDMVAWVNVKNELWVFYDGKSQMLEQYTPEQFAVKDKILYYSQPHQYFRIFDRGVLVDVESFFPEGIQIFDSRLCYLDLKRNLRVYEGGFSSNLSKEQALSYSINGNVIYYFNNINEMVICHKNQKTRLRLGVRSPWGN